MDAIIHTAHAIVREFEGDEFIKIILRQDLDFS
jgi:hypothetical protein